MDSDCYFNNVLRRLNAIRPIPLADEAVICQEMRRIRLCGATEGEAVAYLRNLEEFTPELEEELALSRMRNLLAAITERTGKDYQEACVTELLSRTSVDAANASYDSPDTLSPTTND